MRNRQAEKTFLLNDLKITCWTFKTSTGFGHYAEARRQDGFLIEKVKVYYQNRTWEEYDYQTAIYKLLRKIYKKEDFIKATKEIDRQAKNEIQAFLGGVKGILATAEIIGKNDKEKTDLKKRFLEAVGVDTEPLDNLPVEEQKERIKKVEENL